MSCVKPHFFRVSGSNKERDFCVSPRPRPTVFYCQGTPDPWDLEDRISGRQMIWGLCPSHLLHHSDVVGHRVCPRVVRLACAIPVAIPLFHRVFLCSWLAPAYGHMCPRNPAAVVPPRVHGILRRYRYTARKRIRYAAFVSCGGICAWVLHPSDRFEPRKDIRAGAAVVARSRDLGRASGRAHSEISVFR